MLCCFVFVCENGILIEIFENVLFASCAGKRKEEERERKQIGKKTRSEAPSLASHFSTSES